MKITYPQQDTYFICRNENLELKGYGLIEPHQEMVTPHPIVEQYFDKNEWLIVLLENGVDIEDLT